MRRRGSDAARSRRRPSSRAVAGSSPVRPSRPQRRARRPGAHGAAAGVRRAAQGRHRQSRQLRLRRRGRRPRARSAARRAAQAVPALMEAAAEHADGYVRFRALVLLSGFNDPRARDVMSAALDEPERSPAHGRLRLLRAQPRSGDVAARCSRRSTRRSGEFVRPALTRALAAYGAEPRRCSARCSALLEVVTRPGSLPQRRDRGARRLPGARTRSRAHRGREARRPAPGRCGAGAGQDRRQARARDAGGAAADRARARSRRSPRRSVCSASTASRTRSISSTR